MRRLPGRFYELYGADRGLRHGPRPGRRRARKPGSVGVPPPLYELRIVDADGVDLPPGEVGEIVGRGPDHDARLLQARPDLTAETIVDGWIHTRRPRLRRRGRVPASSSTARRISSSPAASTSTRATSRRWRSSIPTCSTSPSSASRTSSWGETPVAAVRLRPGAATGADELRDWINERVQARYQQRPRGRRARRVPAQRRRQDAAPRASATTIWSET